MSFRGGDKMDRMGIDEISRGVAKALSDITDETILKAIVGSRITAFKLERVKGTKRMWLLHLETDAKPVPLPELRLEDTLNYETPENPLIYRVESNGTRAWFHPGKLTLRVRL